MHFLFLYEYAFHLKREKFRENLLMHWNEFARRRVILLERNVQN